jgi:hypothetical protein
MKTKRGFSLLFSFATSALIALSVMTRSVLASETKKFDKSNWYKEIVNTDFVTQYAIIPIRKDMLIVDSRPVRKYNKGHITPSVNIPFAQFKKLSHLLPENNLPCSFSTVAALNAL